MNLADWLMHGERLHPQAIAMGLERVSQVAVAMGLQFNVPVITVAGTNGKGSTCAMLESVYRHSGFRTGLYTSPHLVYFQERCRLSGEMVRDEALLPHFEKVEAARGKTALSYFEFTSLAIFSCLASSDLDVVILEVGLGGRLDAVNLIDADCAVITSVDLDHMAWLGNDRETIGKEKAGIMRPHQKVVISDPSPPSSVLTAAKQCEADVWQVHANVTWQADERQWTWRGRHQTYSGLGYPALRGAHQITNAAGVLAVTEALRDRLPVTAQGVRLGLAKVSWPGRFQVLPGQPVIVLDVAHNPHAAKALALNLDAMGFFPCTHAVLGAMEDKDLLGLIKPLLPMVQRWYFCDLPTPRASSASSLKHQFQALASLDQASMGEFSDPSLALAQALRNADPADRILVFGSFFTVGGVLQQGLHGRISTSS